MNYKILYDKFINNAKRLPRSKKDGYFESHHIVPKCMGGNNDKANLVLLTAREHFIAHKLLCKIYPDNSSLWFAFNIMAHVKNENKQYKVSSKDYSILREKFSIIQSERMTGSNHPLYNKKHKQETLDKMSKTRKGRKFSEEHKSNLSKSKSGENHPFYGKSSPAKGHKHTDKFKLEVSKRNKGANNPSAKSVEIDGIIYTTMKEASEKTGLSLYLIRTNYINS